MSKKVGKTNKRKESQDYYDNLARNQAFAQIDADPNSAPIPEPPAAKPAVQPTRPQATMQTTQSVIQAWLDNALKTVSPAEKRVLFDTAWPEIEAMGLSAETVLSKKQVIDLQKLLGKYGANYLLKKPVKPVNPTAPVKPTAPAEPTKPVAPVQPVKPVKPITQDELTMLRNKINAKQATDDDLRKAYEYQKTGKWQFGPAANAEFKRLGLIGVPAAAKSQPEAVLPSKPAEPAEPEQPAEPTDIAQVTGPDAGKQKQAIKSGKTNKPKNWQADQGSGWIDTHGERHNYTKDYDPKGVWAKQHNTDVSGIAKIVSSGR